jgi:hypothetical protein
MGQWTVKEAGSALRRMILALLVAALMATMLMASASAAKADVNFPPDTKGHPLNAGDFDQSIGSVVNFFPSGPCVEHFGKNFGKQTGPGC